ncbi:serine/alanine racemase [Listeria grandensis FSL F6-0971]|uniref:Serine/alanine racemase n=1 Tax=Listeria grandensis FSL F6-0971 TaxID=1265819 RepID=W7BAD1_9LIST|nr:acyltransferase family protein [Listeria grandensis]EUJ22937.1 serine/alanine racemase [Listeria grandensis FSL F6-0971]
MMKRTQIYKEIDTFRLVAALLVIAIHTYPFLSFSPAFEVMFSRVFARVAVPFFLMVSGYLLIGPFVNKPFYPNLSRIKNFLKRTSYVYCIAILLYLPLSVYTNKISFDTSIVSTLKMIFFSGTFYHLWYFPATILAIAWITFLLKNISFTSVFVISIVLYVIGLGGDNYYNFIRVYPVMEGFYNIIFQIFGNTRNGLFFAPLFIMLGALAYKNMQVEQRSMKRSEIILFVCSLLMLMLEGAYIHYLTKPAYDDMYIFLVPTSYLLFRWLMTIRLPAIRYARPLSLLLFLLHPIGILIVRAIAKILHFEVFLIHHSMLHYIAVVLITLALSYMCLWVSSSRFWKHAKQILNPQ